MKTYLLLCSLWVGCFGALWVDEAEAKPISPQQEEAARAVDSLFAGVTSIELISLNPHSGWDSDEQRKTDKGERLSGWTVTGKATLTDRKKINQLCLALTAGIRENPGTVAGCFEPRHALHFRHGTEEVTFVICFACQHATVTGAKALGSFLTSGSPDPVFDEVFSGLGLTKTP